MKSTTQLIACLIAVPSVASLAVGPRATNVKASMGSNNPAMCTRLHGRHHPNTHQVKKILLRAPCPRPVVGRTAFPFCCLWFAVFYTRVPRNGPGACRYTVQ